MFVGTLMLRFWEANRNFWGRKKMGETCVGTHGWIGLEGQSRTRNHWFWVVSHHKPEFPLLTYFLLASSSLKGQYPRAVGLSTFVTHRWTSVLDGNGGCSQIMLNDSQFNCSLMTPSPWHFVITQWVISTGSESSVVSHLSSSVPKTTWVTVAHFYRLLWAKGLQLATSTSGDSFPTFSG